MRRRQSIAALATIAVTGSVIGFARIADAAAKPVGLKVASVSTVADPPSPQVALGPVNTARDNSGLDSSGQDSSGQDDIGQDQAAGDKVGAARLLDEARPVENLGQAQDQSTNANVRLLDKTLPQATVASNDDKPLRSLRPNVVALTAPPTSTSTITTTTMGTTMGTTFSPTPSTSLSTTTLLEKLKPVSTGPKVSSHTSSTTSTTLTPTTTKPLVTTTTVEHVKRTTTTTTISTIPNSSATPTTKPGTPAGTTPGTTTATTIPKVYTFEEPKTPPPAPNPKAASVIEWIQTKLGIPYLWGGTGIDGSGYDCSGLSMMAWKQAGINLPRQSGQQWNATARVSKADVMPGDLVFYGTPIHHLGIYIGNNKMIEAPKTGYNIRIASISRKDLVGFGRVK